MWFFRNKIPPVEGTKLDLESTAERLSRERKELSTLMEAISDAILAVDTEGVPMFFNSRFAFLFGNQSRLKIRDIRLGEMFRSTEILEAFRMALDHGDMGFVKAIHVEQNQGRKCFFSLSVSPLKNSSGCVYGAVGIFHDVTELKSAE
jgi:PAS domain S-box-containing protein